MAPVLLESATKGGVGKDFCILSWILPEPITSCEPGTSTPTQHSSQMQVERTGEMGSLQKPGWDPGDPGAGLSECWTGIWDKVTPARVTPVLKSKARKQRLRWRCMVRPQLDTRGRCSATDGPLAVLPPQQLPGVWAANPTPATSPPLAKEILIFLHRCKKKVHFGLISVI